MKILMLSSTFPYPPTRGGTQVRTFNLLKYLSQRYEITLLTQRSDDVTDAEIEALREWVAELVVFPRPETANLKGGLLGKLKRFGRFLQQGIPPSVLSVYSPDIQHWVDNSLGAGKFDAITCEHSVNEIYVRPQFQQQLRTVVNIHSSVYGSCRNQLQTGTAEKPLRDRLNLPLLRRYEQQYCSKFSRIVVTTDEDRQQIQAFNPDSQIYVIPNGVDFCLFPYRSADPGGHHLVFIGAMDNLANIDAVIFLSREILPAIQQRYPDTTLTLVGSRPTAEVLALGTRPSITVTGRVPSMADYLHQATACVVSMRTGYGIKNKTLEAMAAGVPVVGSDRGLEGLEVEGEGVPLRALRANAIAEYVEAVTRLFENAQLRKQLSENGRSFIEQNYTWERAAQLYEQVICGD
ncbi:MULTISPECIES: glycosyltransferase family 4 protein [unclassified Coleofasciculus]|uniref:glycosyltransferase family 4 protein n=1 Tax=unclassified Coleofasciculus TaxID=2692782 RepID=UPI00187DFD69|nr:MULTISPECIES: glycosyltransferase family 4 protein [unclassified Coleofasciculus]MBE9125899.1 glycosyltransferase [Coleofasciculus sp. LEGE 07081]MBE9149089.1 glycosyltransferase [Coleofasciculus sp. LEGE 07092]